MATASHAASGDSPSEQLVEHRPARWYAVDDEIRVADDPHHGRFGRSPSAGGIAALRLIAWGHFTIGAVVQHPRVTPEHDMQGVEGLPALFMNR